MDDIPGMLSNADDGVWMPYLCMLSIMSIVDEGVWMTYLVCYVMLMMVCG